VKARGGVGGISCRVVMLIVCACGLLAVQPVLADGLYQGNSTLTFGEPVVGTLDNDLFRQVYAFEGRAGEIVTISMVRVEGDLDPYLLLTDDQGVILSLSDDEGPATDALITSRRLPEDGRYFVIATRFGQEHGSTSGQYSLLVERVGVGPTDVNTIRYGDRVLGQITDEEPLVFYFLRAERGDVINLSMRRSSGSLDPSISLATSDGQVLISNDDDPNAEGTLDAGIGGYTVLKSDVYLIVASRFGQEAGDTTGTFLLSVTQTPPEELAITPEQARLIDYGMTLDGSIDGDVPGRYFRFDGQRGDVVTVTLVAQDGNLDPLLKLLDASLFVLAQDDNGGENRNARIAAYTLPADGSYYLFATRFGELTGKTSGSFSLGLSGRAGIVGGQALEIVYGAEVSGLIDSQNDSEAYVFFGQQDDVIRIAMDRASGDIDPLVTLYDGERKQIEFDDDSGGEQNALIDRFVLPGDGMYLIAASRFDKQAGTTSGAYLLTLELVRSGR
jgi:hypothetical protein